MPAFRGPDGKIIYASDDDAGRFESGGYERVGEAAAGAAQNRLASVDNGITGSIGATVSAGLSGATLGASDWLLKGVLDKGQFEQMAQDRADNPVLAGTAQFAGALLPAVVSGGTATPSGYLSHLAAEGIGSAEAFGGAAGAAKSLAIAGGEGAIQNAGIYLSDVALGDRDMTAEGMVGALGTGFAFGSGGLIAGHAVSAGTTAARRMFARYAAGGEEAAQAAQSAWQEQSAKALESFDQAATAAQTKLQEAQLARQQADVARRQASAAVAEAKIAPPPDLAITGEAAPTGAAPQASPDVEIAGMMRDRAMAATDPQRMAAWDAQNGPRLQELMAARGPTADVGLGEPASPTATAIGRRTDDLNGLMSQLKSMSAPQEADLVAKLREYQDARAAFHDTHASVDPDLDDVLRGSLSVDVQREPVPVGEFGAPGSRGYKPGEVPAPGPPSQAPLENAPEGTPVTRMLRKGNGGEPTKAFDFKESGLSFDPETRSYFKAEPEAPTIPEYDAIKAHEAKHDDYLERTVPAREIAARGYYEPPGGGTDAVRNANARKAIADGQREAIKLNVSREGKITVTDGRHRLQAAIEANAPIKVKWSTGYEPAESDVLRHGPAAKPMEPAGDDLLAQLRGTAAKVGEGKSIVEIGAESPARADYVSKKLAKREADAAYFRAKAKAKAGEHAFTVNHPHLGPTELSMSIESASVGESPRTIVKVTRRTAGGDEVPVATAEFSHRKEGLYPEHVVVDQPWQRQGIGTRMYKAAEESSGIDAIPSRDQTPEGRAFSDKYRAGRDSAKPPGSDLDPFFAELRRPKTRNDYVAQNIGRAMREEGSHAAALAKVEREWASMSGEAKPAEHPLAMKQLELAHDDALERATTATEPAAKEAAQAEAKAIEQQMTAVGKKPGAVEDVAVMAPAVHRLEKAATELTEALGPEAPAAAQEHAQAFRQAEDAAQQKTVSRAARAADDHALEQGKAQADDLVSGPSAKDRAVAVAKRQRAEAEAAYQKARVAEAEASIGAKRAKAAAGEARANLPPQPGTTLAARGTGIGHRVVQGAHALGYAAELGSDLGIPGIPRPHDIPVIGPLLSAYLKYRAFRAAAGRFVGRIPATAETHAAELAAKTRDGIARSMDRAMGLVERNPTVVRKAVTLGAMAANEALSKRLIDDGHPDAPDGASASQLAAVRMREVAAAVANPTLISDMVRQQTRGVVDPDLITALESHLTAMFQHLNDTAPKGPPPNPLNRQDWKPPAAAALQWGQRVAVAQNPQVAFDLLEAGKLTPAAADTLSVCYQKLFAEAQARLAQRAADMKNPMPYRQLVQAGMLFGTTTHPSLDPENATVMQQAHVAPPQPTPQPTGGPPAPGVAAPTNVTALYQTTADRRAAR